jgi:hypothetical protein
MIVCLIESSIMLRRYELKEFVQRVGIYAGV